MQATVRPDAANVTLMSRKDLESEVHQLRSRDKIQNFQIGSLEKIQQITTQALSHVETRVGAGKIAWVKKKIVEISQRLATAIANITEVTKEGLLAALRGMYRLSLEIGNFLYDHLFDFVGLVALTAAAAMLVFNVIVLGSAVYAMAMGTAQYGASAMAAVASGQAIYIDYAWINEMAGF